MAVALACQSLLLPAICFGLVVLFDLPPLLGIGMLLLAASPGRDDAPTSSATCSVATSRSTSA